MITREMLIVCVNECAVSSAGEGCGDVMLLRVGKHAKPELELEPRRDAQSCLHVWIQNINSLHQKNPSHTASIVYSLPL